MATAFGNVKTTGSRNSDNFKVSIEQDSLDLDTPLVAFFYAPAALFQVEPQKTLVGLYVTPTPQTMRLFMSVLGQGMCLLRLEPWASPRSMFLNSFLDIMPILSPVVAQGHSRT